MLRACYMKVCSITNMTSMLCRLPPFNFPADIVTSNDTRRQGLAPASVHSVAGNTTANVYLGFRFDNFNKYSNISKSLPRINFTLTPIGLAFTGCSSTLYQPTSGLSITVRVSNFTVYDVVHVRQKEHRTLNGKQFFIQSPLLLLYTIFLVTK